MFLATRKMLKTSTTAAKNLDVFMVNVPKGKEELYHQEFLEQIIERQRVRIDRARGDS